MGLSLREKLKNAGMASGKRETKPQSQDCFVRVSRYPLKDLFLRDPVPAQALERIDGKPWQGIARQKWLFLDTETTGLSGGAGTVAFLVGLGYFDGDDYVLEQLVLRDYDEEPYLIDHMIERVREHPVLCTYNGASFDVPLLRSRCIMWRRRMPCEEGHLDLLHPVRRIWGLRIGKCTLKNVEETVLDIRREDDLPGAQVPERFFRYLKERDFMLLEDVLRHNVQDICSLPLILERLIGAHMNPLESMADAQDLFSVGKVLEKRGNSELAGKCYRASDRGSVAVLARKKLADLERRTGHYGEAAQQYERALAIRRSAKVHIAAAKVYEHKLKDLDRALEHTRKALLVSDGFDEQVKMDIQKRYFRLLAKKRRQENGNS